MGAAAAEGAPPAGGAPAAGGIDAALYPPAAAAADGHHKQPHAAGDGTTADQDAPKAAAAAGAAGGKGEPVPPEDVGHPTLSVKPWRRMANVLLLGAGWCFAAAILFIQVANTSIVAATIKGGGPSIATIPVAVFSSSAAASVLPAAFLMRRFGRGPVAIAAAALGLVGGCVEVLALYKGGYALLVVGTLLQGPCFSVANNFRFIAAEFSPPSQRPRAISLVVLCAVPAAVIGPEFARQALAAAPRIGGFAVMLGIYGALLIVLACVDWRTLRRLEAAADAGVTGVTSVTKGVTANAPAAAGDGEKGALVEEKQAGEKAQGPRPLLSYLELLLNEDFIGPALIAGISFMGMCAVMSMTPVRMVAANGPSARNTSTWVVESHILGMYAPGFFSASVIRSIGAPATAVIGCIILLTGNALYYIGDHASVYFSGMVLIGLGWHFAYVAPSSLIVGVYAREPRRRLVVQGATDTVVVGLAGVAIGTSSLLATALGWVPFVSFYMGVHGVLLLLALRLWWYKSRLRGGCGGGSCFGKRGMGAGRPDGEERAIAVVVDGDDKAT